MAKGVEGKMGRAREGGEREGMARESRAKESGARESRAMERGGRERRAIESVASGPCAMKGSSIRSVVRYGGKVCSSKL